MKKTLPPALFAWLGLIAGIVGIIYGGYWHGGPGVCVAIFIILFFLFGFGGIVLTGGIAGGLGTAFIWFILYIATFIVMYTWEKFFVDGGMDIPGKKAGMGGDYFADKFLDIMDLAIHTAWNFATSGTKLSIATDIIAIGVFYAFCTNGRKR